MIFTEKTNDGWITSCPKCGWRKLQGVDVPTRHKCLESGETYTYIPPDWASRPPEDRNQVKGRGVTRIIAPGKRPEPSLAKKAINFSKAAVEHISNGRPEATDEQVASRYSICQKCPLFKPKAEGMGVCTHSSCGCSLKAVGMTGKNKLRWADQKCPINRWGKILPSENSEKSGIMPETSKDG